MAQQRFTVDQIAHALKSKAGNIAAAARVLDISRSTIYRRIEASPSLKELLTDTREEFIDVAESALRREVISGNVTAIIFTLKTVGRNRGYVERVEQEHTGKDRGPIQLSWPAMPRLTDDD